MQQKAINPWIVALAVPAILAILAGLGFVFSRLFIGSSAQVEAVADQFQPPPTWRVESEIINTDKKLCWLAPHPCPSVIRTYVIPERLAFQQFDDTVSRPGWDLDIDGTCEPWENSQGSHTVCSASGRVAGFDVELSESASSEEEDDTIIRLSVLGQR